jgi:hypothetical protein
MIKKLHNPLINFLLIFTVISLISCDNILEEILDDCNSYNYPVLNSKQLKVGKENEFYSDYVKAEIRNDPHDDSDYNYSFNVSDGLPYGMYWTVEGRKVFLKGSPEVSGSYKFTVEVWAEVNQEWWYLEEVPELCNDYSSKEFTLNIVE